MISMTAQRLEGVCTYAYIGYLRVIITCICNLGLQLILFSRKFLLGLIFVDGPSSKFCGLIFADAHDYTLYNCVSWILSLVYL